jgi:hypothetical protein
VTWDREIPVIPPIEGWLNATVENGPRPRHIQANPNAPIIDPASRGLANAVVFLRGVDPAAARPWDLPPVQVVQGDLRFHVHQGAVDSLVGFVRQGDPIAMTSRDPLFHSLHADGAEFFTLAFPDPDQPLSRRLRQRGLVELSSAAGYCWMRAYLFVDNHPYYSRTDAQGRFVLERVPAGNYEVVCWVPNWKKARHEREPETALIIRLFYQPPMERTQAVALRARENREVNFAVAAKEF